MIWVALPMFVVMCAVAALALRGLIRWDAKLAGKGSAPAPGSPAPRHPWFERCKHGVQFLDECIECPGGNPEIEAPVWPQDRATDITFKVQPLCRAQGPAGMRCDIPPHTDRRHEYEGCGWYEGGGPHR